MEKVAELLPSSRKTRAPGGYMGKILRVDLTSGSIRDENLSEEPVLRKFIGGQALEAGHRSVILQSLFATQRGWVADFDWKDVGPRFLEPIPDGKYQGFTIAKWLPDLVYEYYRLSGRHERTGRPFKETLTKLGLEEFAEWSQLD